MVFQHILLQQRQFDQNEEAKTQLQAINNCGAMVSFSGYVRADTGVKELFVEHYPGMTESSLARIVEKAKDMWPVLGVTLIHRVGALFVGEPIVLVITSCSHRQDAYNANRFIMDSLKTDAVFWKKETMLVNGCLESCWVESTNSDIRARREWENIS